VSTAVQAPEQRPPVPVVSLSYVLVVGIVAWTAHLVGGSALVPAACAHDSRWVIDVLTVVTALVAASGIPVALRLQRRFGELTDVRSQVIVWLAAIGILFEVINIGLILLEGAPNLVLDPCS
jgi:hypothetical protein